MATIKKYSFASFPEFTHLTLSQKAAYEDLIKNYPPLSDLSFAGLMTWWNQLDSCRVAILNNNLVISYWLPGDEQNSGLCLVGGNSVDESICAIFDYQREEGMTPRLVHVPEFVISNLRYPGMFAFMNEGDYSEAVFAVKDIYPLATAKPHIKRQVKRFTAKFDDERVSVRSIDLSRAENQALLLECGDLWVEAGNINYIAELDTEVFAWAIKNAEALETENCCVFIDGKLAGMQLFQRPADKRYIIATFVRVNPDIPGISEYLLHRFAERLAEEGVVYINYEQDLGVQTVRMQKVAVGPVNFLRKYTIEPAGEAK